MLPIRIARQVRIMLRTRQWKTPVSRALATSWLVLAATAILSPAGFSQTVSSGSQTLTQAAGATGGMLSQARFLQERSAHDQAVSVLREALQTIRMKQGLYHEDQFEVIDSMIESEVARENWQRVDDHYALLLNLYENLYADDAENLEQGLIKATRWHVDALRYDLDGRTVPHLREVRELLKSRLRIARRSDRPDIPKIERLREGIQIAEAQLILYSDGNGDELRRQQALRRALLLSSLE